MDTNTFVQYTWRRDESFAWPQCLPASAAGDDDRRVRAHVQLEQALLRETLVTDAARDDGLVLVARQRALVAHVPTAVRALDMQRHLCSMSVHYIYKHVQI